MGEDGEALYYTNKDREPINVDREIVAIEQEEAIAYLSTTFQDEFIAASKHMSETQGTKAAIEFANVQIKYLKALREISGPYNERFKDENELRYWDSRVKHALFDEKNEGSLQHRAKRETSTRNVASQLIGVTNLLTFINVAQDIYDDGTKVDMIVADPELDALGKVDLVLSHHDTINLVQLKASIGNTVNVFPIENDKSPHGDNIKDRDVKKMLSVAESWREATGKDVRVTGIELPGMGASSIGNVFGVPLGDRSELVQKFRNAGNIAPAAAA